jgi:2'-5' RNA ligase
MAAGSDVGAAAATSLILTLELDGESFAQLDRLRRRYYAPERNLVPAHVTLFHALPNERAREISAFLGSVAAGQRRIEVAVGDVRPLEGGVAVFLHSPQLAALRAALAREWEPWLTDQDRLGFRPHVTLGSAAGEAEARRLAREVSASLRLRRLVGEGLHLWRYRGGPWQDVRLFRFGS